jgi:ClpX C4-type zinc finger
VTITPELLEMARASGRRVDEAERQALLARAEHHAAVRRIHLAGASLREIARALSLSHQRVQQIVSGAGGSWWRRIWRTRQLRPDAVCTWCERPPSEVAKLIAGPNVFICDACVESAERVVRRTSAHGPFAPATKRRLGARCAFCGKPAGKTRSLVTAPAGHVCTDCVSVCREILDGRPDAVARAGDRCSP